MVRGRLKIFFYRFNHRWARHRKHGYYDYPYSRYLCSAAICYTHFIALGRMFPTPPLFNGLHIVPLYYIRMRCIRDGRFFPYPRLIQHSRALFIMRAWEMCVSEILTTLRSTSEEMGRVYNIFPTFRPLKNSDKSLFLSPL